MTEEHPKSKRRNWIDDDFFSMSVSKKKTRRKKGERSKVETIEKEALHKPTDEDKLLELPVDHPLDEFLDHREELSNPIDIDPSQSEQDLEILHTTNIIIAAGPHLDRDAIRLKIQQLLNLPKDDVEDVPEEVVELIEEDSDDDIPMPIKSSDGRYDFTEEHERKRMYVIRVFTKLPVPNDYSPSLSSDFGAKGTKKFARILEAVNQNYTERFRNKIANIDLYATENTCLIWLDGKMELKSFFKPSTLRIPPPEPFDLLANEVESMAPTYVDCMLIPKEHSENYMDIYPEFKTVQIPQKLDPLADSIPELLVFAEDVIDIDEEDQKTKKEEAEREATKEEFFIIGLKGKDNKKINVEVHAGTPIKKLLLYYLESKNIDIKSVNLKKAALIFDDEELDLDATVGDTELEEDFEVQVVI